MRAMRHWLSDSHLKSGQAGAQLLQKQHVAPLRRVFCLLLCVAAFSLASCRGSREPSITVGSKFFTEQVVLGELLAQHIEARTGIHVKRKSNLGGTLLCQKALLAGELDLYVEYTGTALTSVLGEAPDDTSHGDAARAGSSGVGESQGSLRVSDAAKIYERVKNGYEQRFHLTV